MTDESPMLAGRRHAGRFTDLGTGDCGKQSQFLRACCEEQSQFVFAVCSVPVRALKETPYGVTTSEACPAKQSQFQGAAGRERRTRSYETKPIRRAYCVEQSQFPGEGRRLKTGGWREPRGWHCETKPISGACQPGAGMLASRTKPISQAHRSGSLRLVCETKPIGGEAEWSVSAAVNKGCVRKCGRCLCEKQSRFVRPDRRCAVHTLQDGRGPVVRNKANSAR